MMIQIPRFEAKKLDTAKIYDWLTIASVTNVNFPTNYYLLTQDQKEFVDLIVRCCEGFLNEQIENYNEDLDYFEEDINDN